MTGDGNVGFVKLVIDNTSTLLALSVRVGKKAKNPRSIKATETLISFLIVANVKRSRYFRAEQGKVVRPSMKITMSEIIEFENEIAGLYKSGHIRAPIHLRSGSEEYLIDVFNKVKKDDYIFSYWASHIQCLLKGVPQEQLKDAIVKGDSIALSFPEYRILCSGIVGSLAGVAVGTAYTLKRSKKQDHVWLFTGDMGAECGIFHEALKYAVNQDLPITFVVEDNGVSVVTDTKETWGAEEPWFKGTRFEKKVIYFQYKNGWPHSGIGARIAF